MWNRLLIALGLRKKPEPKPVWADTQFGSVPRPAPWPPAPPRRVAPSPAPETRGGQLPLARSPRAALSAPYTRAPAPSLDPTPAGFNGTSSSDLATLLLMQQLMGPGPAPEPECDHHRQDPAPAVFSPAPECPVDRSPSDSSSSWSSSDSSSSSSDSSSNSFD